MSYVKILSQLEHFLKDTPVKTHVKMVNTSFKEACYGNFMCTDDQQVDRRDTLAEERVIMPTNTNYQVHANLPEFSLPLKKISCFFLLTKAKLLRKCIKLW